MEIVLVVYAQVFISALTEISAMNGTDVNGIYFVSLTILYFYYLEHNFI